MLEDGLDHFKSRQNPQIAVVAPARGDSVDVRSGHDRGCRVGPRHRSDHIAYPVDHDRHAEVAHPSGDQISAAAIVIRQSES